MRRVWISLAVLSVTAISIKQLDSAVGLRAVDKASLPGSFRVKVNEVIHDDDIALTQVEFETGPGCSIELNADQSGRGGLTSRSTEQPDGDGLVRSRLIILGDHVVWGDGTANALKFMMKITSGAATAKMTHTGPLENATDLTKALSVLIQSGEYRYDEPVKAVRFQDVTYSVVVKGK
jgi:hypothetical protein